MIIKPNTISKKNRTKTNTKKASANKLRVIENAKRILNNITICNMFVPAQREEHDGWGNSAVYSRDTRIRVTPALAWNLGNIRVKWEVTCGVFHRTQQGEHFITYYTIEADKECLDVDISMQAQQVCAYMFENASKLTRLCPFWLAVPRTYDDNPVNINLAFKTAHLHKVFNRIGSDFEINCNMPYVDYHTGEWFNIPIAYDKFEEADIDLEEALKFEMKIKDTEDGKVIDTK